jgi:ABC-2 type transport system permease protein
MNIWTIFKRELKNYFNSPIAYIFMVVFLGFMGFVFFFFFHFYAADDANMKLYFAAMPWFFTVFTAAMSMRLWSEEKKLGTLELLLTVPMRSHQIVVGKYLAGLTILALTLLMTFTVPATVAIVGDPDWGKIATGYMGAFMAGALLLALGACVSATTENQIVALMVTSVLGVLLMALGIEYVGAEVNNFFGGFKVGDFLTYFSPLTHYDNLERGVLDLRDVIYFASMTVLALLLNHIAVERRKY